MSDRVAVMSNGSIEQIGTPVEVYGARVRLHPPLHRRLQPHRARRSTRSPSGRRRSRSSPSERPGAPDTHVEAGQVTDVIYVGVLTRYVVALDAGGELVLSRQNAAEAQRQPSPREIRSASPGGPRRHSRFRDGPGQQRKTRVSGEVSQAMTTSKRRGTARRSRSASPRYPSRWPPGSCSAAAGRPARPALRRHAGSGGATQQPGTAGLTVPTANLPVLTSVGAGEGKLNLIAWEGYLDTVLGPAVPEADRLHRQRQVRRQLRRDGLADEGRRRRPVRHGLLLRGRGPAHPVRRRRAPGEHEPDPGRQGLLPGLPGARRSTPSTASTTASPCSRAPTS